MSRRKRPIAPRHFLDLQRAAIMNTEGYALTRMAVPLAVEEVAMVAIVGEAGLGKTFAVSAAVQAQKDTEPVWVESRPKATPKTLLLKLLDEASGVVHDGTYAQISETLLELLAGKPRLVVVDEAQRLDRDCIEALRWLWDEPDSQFSLVFVGGQGCWDVLCQYHMLLSRFAADVHFAPLSSGDVQELIPNYHPIYAGVDTELVLLIDDAFGHGVFRNWASFTKRADHLCRKQKLEHITEAVVQNVFGHFGGKRGA